MDAPTLESYDVLTPPEMEFNAEGEEIEIVPNFAQPETDLQFIEGTYGPFRPQMPTRVPLWLALFLKRRRRCTIITPEWLQKDNLDAKLESERASEHEFQELPYHFHEISDLLFREARDDITDLHAVRERVSDLVSVRRNKVFTGLQNIKSSAPVELANVCNSEVALIRSFMRKALAQYHRLETAETAAAARASANAAANVARQRAEVAAQQQAARAAAAAAAQQR